ncbi:hypothetical protein V495_02077 [Pseudogymnoascus sp. VKM F-4514 (FW-929)]|nr:hypothetical protein V495_02077 [Pseudogymnoascus sp. VKM F-4514 (FW-929)]KFY66396.1 hypothetical protein V497_00939 [Pseudogymnoascus sp. VKM F-4516 (FW-969)]
MRTSLFAVFALLSYSLAAPTEVDARAPVCPELKQAACCYIYSSTAIFGCILPEEPPIDQPDFESFCDAHYKKPLCCTRVTEEGWGEDCSGL